METVRPSTPSKMEKRQSTPAPTLETMISYRRNTPLYYLKTASDRIEMVLWLMAENAL